MAIVSWCRHFILPISNPMFDYCVARSFVPHDEYCKTLLYHYRTLSASYAWFFSRTSHLPVSENVIRTSSFGAGSA